MGRTNGVAKAIYVLAIISAICGVFAAIGAGFIFGETTEFEYGYYYTYTREEFEYSWTAFFTVLLATPIEVIFLLGFSEIIECLYRITDHLGLVSKAELGEPEDTPDSSNDADRPASSEDDENPWELEQSDEAPKNPERSDTQKKPGYFDSLKPRI